MINEYTLSQLNSEDLTNLTRILNLVNLKKPKNEIMLGDFVQEYIGFAEQSFSDKYIRSLKLSLKYLIEELGQHRSLYQITIKDVEHLMIKLKKQAPKGIKVYFRNLKAVFNKARDWDYIAENPFLRIKIQKTMETKPDFIKINDLELLVNQVTNQIIKNIIITAYYTGCRLNEIISLKVKHIDFKEKLLTVGDSQTHTKNRKQRKIPINDKVMEILLKQLEVSIDEESHLFPKSSGYKYDGDYISKIFKKAVRNCGLKETIHFHSLRHSFGSNLGLSGVPLITVKELMGHSSITTTQIYSHTTINDMRIAIEKLS